MAKALPNPQDREPGARLAAARARKYAGPDEAARALGVPEPTYRSHENGWRGFARNAERYAKFFGVSLDWLLTGRGSMTGPLAPAVEVFGRIGAGAVVTLEQDGEELADGKPVALPSAAECWAFVVEGESMLPRFYPGEVVVFEREAAPENELVGQYCLVQIKESGDRMVKILRLGRSVGRWWLDSHNSGPIEDVELIAAWRWRATLPARDGRGTLAHGAVAQKKRR